MSDDTAEARVYARLQEMRDAIVRGGPPITLPDGKELSDYLSPEMLYHIVRQAAAEGQREETGKTEKDGTEKERPDAPE